MNFNIDIISKGLPKGVARIETEVPRGTFLQDVIFGAGTVMGNDKSDKVEFDWRKGTAIALPEESIRGQEATRVNYRTGFNADVVTPNYYNRKDEVTLEDADTRVFGEEITEGNAGQMRVMRAFAEKTQALRAEAVVAKETMCKDAIFNASVTNASGSQTYPMTSSLLSISGANLYTAPMKTITDAYKAIRAKNKAFVAKALIMNLDDAINLVNSTAVKDYVKKTEMNLAEVVFKKAYEGVVSMGMLSTPAGNLAILAYVDVDPSGNAYIPQGKAILYGDKIGKMAYGRLKAADANGMPHYIVATERMVAYKSGEGDDAHMGVQFQTAPLPLITNIDGYGVLTSIPSSL